MRVASLILTMFLAAVSAAGQVTTAKDDISQERYFAAEKKAAEMLQKVNYRSVKTKESFAERSKEPKLEFKTLVETVWPNKWRTVIEKYVGKPRRDEIISDGKKFYFRTDDGPWLVRPQVTGSAGGMFGETVSHQYRYLPAVDLDGKTVELYELISIRNASPSSRNAILGIRYTQTIRIWYSAEGKILKKTDETAIESRPQLLRETTTFEYDPKDLKIEAPKI